MNKLDSSRFTVNIYDVFANFLPGFIFLGGTALPFLTSDTLSGLSVIEGTLFLFVAFAVGGLMQAVGSYAKHYQFRLPFCDYPSESADKQSWWLIEERVMPFNYLMDRIKQNPDELSLPESEFLSRCKEIFEFDEDSEIEDWGYLFKICITQLEVSPHNRTLRIQAQHLATRGLCISLFFLFVYYITIAGIQWILIDYLQYQQLDLLPGFLLVVMGILSLIISYIFYLRSVHFEEDVVNYMISEIVASASTNI